VGRALNTLRNSRILRQKPNGTQGTWEKLIILHEYINIRNELVNKAEAVWEKQQRAQSKTPRLGKKTWEVPGANKDGASHSVGLDARIVVQNYLQRSERGRRLSVNLISQKGTAWLPQARSQQR
jgi:hypothetical protein